MANRIATSKVETGTGAWIDLPFSSDAAGESMDIPAFVINGGDGPTLWYQACVHGDEHTGSIALRDFVTSLDPTEVRGRIIAVPIANRAAFNAKDRVAPIDNQDLNRLFPGDDEGSYSDRLAHTIYKYTSDHADYFIDLHSGRTETYIEGYSIFPSVGGEVERYSRELCAAANLPYAIRFEPGELNGLLFSELASEGIPAVIIETGGEGRLHQRHISKATQAIKNIAFETGVLSGNQEREVDVSYHEGMTFVKAPVGGYFELEVDGNQNVSEGETLARITGFKGNLEHEVKSPIDGVVVSLRTYGVARPGDQLFELTPIEE